MMLLSKITVHYPAMDQRWKHDDGKFRKDVVEEWYRLIGFLSYEDAMKKFDQYLRLPDGNRYAPDVKWFLTAHSPSQAREEPRKPGTGFDRIDRFGNLTDAEGRLYAFSEKPYEKYHYDSSMRIMDSAGRLVR